MQTRISQKLKSLKALQKKSFVAFVTAGDPHLEATEEIIYALDECGVSMIEIGVPFSDPMADGPVIQKSSERALAAGVTIAKIFELVKKVRKKTEIPIILMGYYNPILQYGLKKFAHDAAQAGVDGLIIVDLPPEESSDLQQHIKKLPIDIIYLLAPTSNKKRIDLVNQHGSGFVYYVSFTGITGGKQLDFKDIQQKVKNIKTQITLPLQIGFGISQPSDIEKLAPLADGVVVGSALIKVIEQKPFSIQKVKSFISSLVKALPS